MSNLGKHTRENEHTPKEGGSHSYSTRGVIGGFQWPCSRAPAISTKEELIIRHIFVGNIPLTSSTHTIPPASKSQL